jgi:hypothetical protein
LGALAKSTGGIGLRSAIKVIQDILVEGLDGRSPVADQPVGWLATTMTLFDALDKDIRRAFPSIHQAVGKVQIRFPDSPLHQEIAKSVAVLQILGNLPVTIQNVASLMHPSVSSGSRLEEVRKAIEQMLNDVLVPLGEKDGNLHFLSEKLRDIEQERGGIPLRAVDVRRIVNDALRETFDPLPRVTLHGTMAVASGLKTQSGSSVTSLAGEQNTLQTVVEFVQPTDYEAARNRMLDDSRSRSGQSTIGLVARADPGVEDVATEIYRCQRIAELHRNEPDQEIKEYCIGQLDRAAQRQIHRLLPHVPRVRLERTRGRTAGVRHENVDAAKFVSRFRRDARDLCGIGDVSDNGVYDRVGLRNDVVARRLERVAPSRAHDDVSSFAREFECDRAPEAATRRGHERDLSA